MGLAVPAGVRTSYGAGRELLALMSKLEFFGLRCDRAVDGRLGGRERTAEEEPL